VWEPSVPDLTIFKSGQSRTWPNLGTEIRMEPDPDFGSTHISDHIAITTNNLRSHQQRDGYRLLQLEICNVATASVDIPCIRRGTAAISADSSQFIIKLN